MVPTAITIDAVAKVGAALTFVPDNFKIFPKLKKTLLERRAHVRPGGLSGR